MDLSKKTMIGSLIGLFLIALTNAAVDFMKVDNSPANGKVFGAFQIIFSILVIITAAVNAFIMYRDGMLEIKHYIILGGILIMGLFDMVAYSILIDAVNGNNISISSGKAVTILPAIASILSVPVIAGAGYLMSEL